MKIKYTTYSTIFTLFLNGCGGGSSDSTPTQPPAVNPTPAHKIVISDDIHVERLGTQNRIINVETGNTPRDIFILLTNYSQSEDASVEINHSNTTSNRSTKVKSYKYSTTSEHMVLNTHERIQEFIKDMHRHKHFNHTEPSQEITKLMRRSANTVGESKTFYLDLNTSPSTVATLKKVVSQVHTDQGIKTLTIWVSDDSFDNGSGCSKNKCITQEMVNILADHFLKTGTNNDIYDWVTNIYGEEWGDDAQSTNSNLISSNNEISILITDIDNDNFSDGGVLGYFYPKDNYKTGSFSGSNERIMFYIDSVIFANGEDAWDINDPWPKEIMSTLAHEFQHMIHFYQKDILLNVQTETWLNEMLAESTEDLVATKIMYMGPRGVDYLDGSAGEAGNIHGRYPLFNSNNTQSLTQWYNSLSNYSVVNSFGAYLLRNYGGANLFHDIVHNSYGDEEAIVHAINQNRNESKTFNDLLREWGIGIMLSDQENLQNLPTYNSGDFTYSDYNNISYELGSVNFFNYDPEPNLFTTLYTVKPQANYYYKVGSDITGNVDINITLNGTTEATLITK